MNRYIFFLFLAVSIYGNAQDTIEINNLKEYLKVLASDEFEGREAGSSGGEKAANYIRKQFKDAGLTLLGNDGFQPFIFKDGRKMGDQVYMKINNYVPKAGADYASYFYTQNANVKSKVVFVGFGIENEIRNDYKNVDVKGKWVLMISGNPVSEEFKNTFISQSKKVDNAREKGAKGIILTDPFYDNPNDTIIPGRFASVFVNMPVVQIKRSVCDSFLANNQLSIDPAVTLLSLSDTVLSMELDIKFTYRSDNIVSELKGINVVGLIAGGDPRLQNEIIIAGAHFDHLGIRYKNSNPVIYYGADDNASGTAGIIELSKQLAQSEKKLKRTVVFVVFDAEEKGLLGSEYFEKNLPKEISKSKITAMVNLDMIGRYQDEEGLIIAGYNSSVEGEAVIKSLEEKTKLKLSKNNKMFNGSDHVNFYINNVPVFFFFTGLHKDYHKPSDTQDKIRYEKMSEILDVARWLISELADRDKKLVFKSIR